LLYKFVEPRHRSFDRDWIEIMLNVDRGSPRPLLKVRRNVVAMFALGIGAIATGFAARTASAQNQGGNGQGGNGQGGNGQGGNNQGSHCFLRGTAIRTVDGYRKIEDLAVGDLLPTLFGGVRPIRWIGRYCVRKSAPGDWATDARPVRIAASALGPGVPYTTLYVTQPHALLIDGVLVAAGSLINGTSITLDPARELDQLEYFHIKLESHDVIVAEGAECETLLSVEENDDFVGALGTQGATTIEDGRCAPLLSLRVPRARMKSRFRSAISPWIDRRQPYDVIRDYLEDRGAALRNQQALSV